MALNAYTGLPGAGKTIHAVKWIIEQLRHGRVVVTNIEGLSFDRIAVIHDVPHAYRNRLVLIHPDEKDYISNLHRIAFDALHEALRDITGSMDHREYQRKILYRNAAFVIDEAQLYFPIQTIEKHKEITGVVKWMTRHRHYGQDIVMITQHPDFLDKSIRNVLQFRYHFRKMDFIRIPVIGGSNRYGFQSSDFQSGNHLKKGFGSYDADIWNCYDSALSGASHEYQQKGSIPFPIIAIGGFLALMACGIVAAGAFVLYKRQGLKSKPSGNPAAVQGEHSTQSVPGLSGYIQESPNVFRLLDCNGSTVGYLDHSPRGSTKVRWLSCEEPAAKDVGPVDPGTSLGY